MNVVNRGFEYLCQYLDGANPGSTNYPQPKYIGWGGANGSNATSVVLPSAGPTTTQGTGQWTDVGPYQELTESRVTGTGSVTNNTIGMGTVGYYLTGTLTASTGEAVGESFIVMSTTKPFATTLNSNITSGATSFTVTTSGAPSTPFYMQLNNEVLEVTTITSSTVYTVTRGVNGSTAASASSANTLTVGNIPGAAAANPNDGDMFAHAGFVALTLNTNDSVTFNWTVSITS